MDKGRVDGWLRHQLVYEVKHNRDDGTTWDRIVIFSLVIVPGLYGSRVAVYKNGEKIGRSLRLGGADAVNTSMVIVASQLQILEVGRLPGVVGEAFKTVHGTAQLIARV